LTIAYFLRTTTLADALLPDGLLVRLSAQVTKTYPYLDDCTQWFVNWRWSRVLLRDSITTE
jgi:hypothetical protein